MLSQIAHSSFGKKCMLYQVPLVIVGKDISALRVHHVSRSLLKFSTIVCRRFPLTTFQFSTDFHGQVKHDLEWKAAPFTNHYTRYPPVF